MPTCLKIIDEKDSAIAISFCLFISLFIACSQPKSPTTSNQPLFTAVSSQHSGIEFANEIKENERQNFLTFPYYYNGGGVAVGDINQDGLPDLYFTGNMVGDRLYLNKGNMTFEDITRKAGILKQNLWTTGVTFVDLNNDGYLDIYVCRSGQRGFRNNLLYINQGPDHTPRFVEQAKSYGLNDNAYSVQAYFFDYDLDGDLDVYLVNHSNKFFSDQHALFGMKGNPDPDEADKLYRNDGTDDAGQLHFTEVSEEAGIRHFGFGLSASIGDVNADGLPDIYVANDFFEPDFLYVNQGNGRFTDQLQKYFGHTSFSSMGSDLADFNNDGFPDLMVCDMQAADNYRKKANMASMDTGRFARILREGYHYQYMQNTLQLNTGMGRFSEIAELAGVEETDWSWGPLFFDMDNDGWKDLFISNGIRRDIQYKDILNEIRLKVTDNHKPRTMDLIQHFPVEKLKNYSFRNTGEFTFTDQTEIWGINMSGFSTGAAYADLDLDGDLDLILNNIDEKASIFENHSTQIGSNFLQLELRGEKDNYFGIGANIHISTQKHEQYLYVQSSRGFQSAVEPLVHVGLGDLKKVDEVHISWPNGNISLLSNIDANQRLIIHQNNSTQNKQLVSQPTPFTKESEEQVADIFHHKEIPYDDFASELLLPHKYSQLGPGIAVGDVNGDHLDDFYIGGAHQFAASLFVQTDQGDFKTSSETTWIQDAKYEDIDAAFFDADGDGDEDLYVVSGSNEWEEGSPLYQDRLYINDGKGHFVRDLNALPQILTSGGCVRPCDFDKDGDLDLFVGGRIRPGKYPLAARSYLLENNAGNFSDVTASVGNELLMPGLVTDAIWSDYDNDQWMDLILVGEWMPITFFRNDQGKLKPFTPQMNPSLSNSVKQNASQDHIDTHGWWYSVDGGDMDGDGDIDYFAGNVGLNYKYQTSDSEPFQVFAYDFDSSGSLDIVLGYFNQGQLFPLRGKQCSSEQMPFLKEKFPRYAAFGEATLEEVYGPENLEKATHLKAYTFASVYLENLGEGSFKISNLPMQAQFSSVNDFVITDVNGDGFSDVLLAGNMYHAEVETARNDAGTALLMIGNGKGGFEPILPQESGFFAYRDVKSLAKLNGINNSTLFLVGNNASKMQLFSLIK